MFSSQFVRPVQEVRNVTGLISPAELAEPTTTPETPSTDPATVTLDAVRALVLRAHPDVVPELVTGETIDALLASIEPAQSAHARLVAALGERPEARSTAPSVPAGGFASVPVDPETLPAAEKIRRGIHARRA